MRFSRKELKDLVKAWFIISLAFAIAITGFSLSMSLLLSTAFIGITVGIGFIFHELSHKLIAQRYHCRAEFRAFDEMLLLALVMSFFGFVFAAPGAVMISGHLRKEDYGRISAAGPFTNFVVAALFGILSFSGFGIASTIGSYGFRINAWLGLFNLIPFGNFDGRKILYWSKYAYGALVAVGFALLFVV